MWVFFYFLFNRIEEISEQKSQTRNFSVAVRLRPLKANEKTSSSLRLDLPQNIVSIDANVAATRWSNGDGSSGKSIESDTQKRQSMLDFQYDYVQVFLGTCIYRKRLDGSPVVVQSVHTMRCILKVHRTMRLLFGKALTLQIFKSNFLIKSHNKEYRMCSKDITCQSWHMGRYFDNFELKKKVCARNKAMA